MESMTTMNLTIGQTDPITVQDPTIPVPTKVKDLEPIVGGLSKPSKMPGYSTSIPAQRCGVGAKLRTVKGSVCSGCYALKGCYVFPVVKEALENRFQCLKDPRWTAAFIALLNRKKVEFFRWHDSGDLQSVAHLRNICTVAENTPGTLHWIPTREYRIVEAYRAQYGRLPANLILRASAHMIGKEAPSRFDHSSMVLPKGTTDHESASICPAPDQGNECGDCRACWDTRVSTVAYRYH